MPLILPGNVGSATAGGFNVANSCRFNAPDDAYMHKTPSSDGSRRIGTFSIWIKPALNTSEGQYLFSGSPDATTETSLGLSIDGDDLRFNGWTGNSQHMLLVTDRKFRDPSAWYHIVVAWDTTQGTASNRVKIYINGVQETSFSTETYPDQNRDLNINNASNKTLIGARSTANYAFADGYYSEVVMIDGTALSPTSFGEFDSDSNIWKPIDVSGLTFGTNGFYLDFQASGNLGNDANGGTDFTEVNLAATDQSTDTCTNNFCTMNSLDLYFTNDTLSEGNLLVTNGANYGFPISTFGLSSGKWYFECQTSSWTSGDLAVGISARGSDALGDEFSNNTSGSIGYGFRSNGGVYGGGVALVAADGYTTGSGAHIIGMAVNLDDNKLAFSVNGTWQGSTDPGAGTTNMLSIQASSTNDTGVYFIALSGANSGAQTMNANFGSPAFSISSGNTDGDGYGNFEYAVPSGYFSINTKNLAEYG